MYSIAVVLVVLVAICSVDARVYSVKRPPRKHIGIGAPKPLHALGPKHVIPNHVPVPKHVIPKDLPIPKHVIPKRVPIPKHVSLKKQIPVLDDIHVSKHISSKVIPDFKKGVVPDKKFPIIPNKSPVIGPILPREPPFINRPGICPRVACPAIVPLDCRRETFFNHEGVQCRGCDVNICGNNPAIRGPGFDPAIRGPIVDPSIRGPVIDPTIRGQFVDPSIRGPGFDPAIRGPIVDPSIRGPGFDPAFRGPIVDPAIRGPGFDPAIRGPIVDTSIRGPGFDPAFRGPIVDPSIRGPGFDPAIRGPIVDPSIRGPGFDPAIRRPVVDPSIEGPAVDTSSVPRIPRVPLDVILGRGRDSNFFGPTRNPPFDPLRSGERADWRREQQFPLENGRRLRRGLENREQSWREPRFPGQGANSFQTDRQGFPQRFEAGLDPSFLTNDVSDPFRTDIGNSGQFPGSVGQFGGVEFLDPTINNGQNEGQLRGPQWSDNQRTPVTDNSWASRRF